MPKEPRGGGTVKEGLLMNLKNIPEYVPGHNLLKGKKVVITAAAGTGIGFALLRNVLRKEQ